jgi:hypothetical protein
MRSHQNCVSIFMPHLEIAVCIGEELLFNVLLVEKEKKQATPVISILRGNDFQP